jgi:hypothetical protein
MCAEGNCSYYRARYYDPGAGGFLNEDPIHFRAGINFYRYVHSNPQNFRDPRGKEGIGAVVGTVLGGIYGGLGAAASGDADGGEILAGIVTGAWTGGILGALDPTLGLVTVVGITAGGDALGQLVTGHGIEKCKPFNWGSTLGAGLGGALGGWGGQLFKGVGGWVGTASVGALTGGPGTFLPGILGNILGPNTPPGCECGGESPAPGNSNVPHRHPFI